MKKWEEMYWLLYDITDNRKRTKIVQICKDYGLTRVQKSCFFGAIQRENRKEFEKKLDLLVAEEDQICMIPVTDGIMQRTKIWGKNMKEQEQKEVCFW